MKDIKIFVSHRNDKISQVIDNPLYINIVCGAELAEDKGKLPFSGDNTGEHISQKKEHFSELTVMYWAWKNIEADYYGLCHYRRYFSFAKENVKDDLNQYIDKGIAPKGQKFLVYPYITPNAIKLFGLDELSMRGEIENTDVILREPVDVRKLDNLGYKHAIDGRKKNKALHNIEDVNKLMQIIHEKYPVYDDIVKEYYNSPYGQWFDCFVMKKEIYFSFCEWIFDILFELERRINYETYNYQMIRAVAYLSEDLFGIYFKKATQDKLFKITYKPLVLFQNTDTYIEPHKKCDLTIVLSCNENSVLQASVTINSIIKNIDIKKECSIIILGNQLIQESINLLKLYNSDNVHVDIVSTSEFWHQNGIIEEIPEGILEQYNNIFEAYLLSQIDKAIFIKAGCIVKKNIYLLNNIDMKGNAIAAIKDIILAGYINGANDDVIQYYANHPYNLDPYNQYNGDVLLVNFKTIRETYSLKTIIQYLKQDKFPNSQDFLNHIFENRFMSLDSKWNVFAIDNEQGYAIELTPYKYWKEFQATRTDPYIVNYVTRVKPWKEASSDLSAYFWQYAQNSYGYEQLLKLYCENVPQNKDESNRPEKLFKTLRDVFLPYGTRRRNVVYNIYVVMRKIVSGGI